MDDSTNIFDLYSGKSLSSETVNELPIYQAYSFGLKDEQKYSLIFFMSDGSTICKPYGALLEIQGVPPFDLLVFTYTDCTIRVEGEDLGYLLQDLNTASFEALGCYDPEVFSPPADDGPVIVNITRISLEGTA